jgi:hypothetical protein
MVFWLSGTGAPAAVVRPVTGQRLSVISSSSLG